MRKHRVLSSPAVGQFDQPKPTCRELGVLCVISIDVNYSAFTARLAFSRLHQQHNSRGTLCGRVPCVPFVPFVPSINQTLGSSSSSNSMRASSSSSSCRKLSCKQQTHQPGNTPHPRRLVHSRLGAATTDVEQVASFPGLTVQQVQQFHEDGFLTIPGFASHEQVRRNTGAESASVTSGTLCVTHAMHGLWHTDTHTSEHVCIARSVPR